MSKPKVHSRKSILAHDSCGEASGDQLHLEDEEVSVWFKEIVGKHHLYEKFLEKYETIAILHLIKVYHEFRNKGHGNRLLNEFLEQTDADIIVCWATGFPHDPVDFLPHFYKKAGFKAYGNLMVLVRK
jgi:GNAT superfamily N-acetyltransferase